MFFDLSPRKLRLLSLLSVLFVLATISLVIGIQYISTEHSFRERLQRQGANFSYWFNFKMPRDVLAAVTLGLYDSDPFPSATASGTAQAVPVLIYHGEGDSGSAIMSTAVFVDQMRTLKNAGWHTITLAQFEAFMKGTGTVPAKSFLLTFDDGRSDAFYATDPVLKDFGYTAVMFVITGFSLPENSNEPVGKFYLSKSELAYMQESGRWELESHGDQDHLKYQIPRSASTSTTFIGGQDFLSNLFWLPAESRMETPDEFATRVTHDLALSKKMLQDDFHKQVTTFAYPFNDFGENTQNFPEAKALLNSIVPQVYDYAFYQTGAGNGDVYNYPGLNQYMVKRIEPGNKWTGQQILEYLETRAPKALPYTATNFTSGWDSNWGVFKPAKDSLSLRADPSTTGASAYLNGGEYWKDYRVTATATLRMGTFSLIARQTESAVPYAVCAFAQDKVYLERHNGTVGEMIASARYTPPAIPASWSVSMQVQGDSATCSAYGVKVSGSILGVPNHGNVGISIWDPEPGTADTELTNIKIEPL